MRFGRILIGVGLLTAVLAATGHLTRQQASPPLAWTPFQIDVPPSIRVFADTGAQPRAWYVDIDYNDKSLHALPWLSASPTKRETSGAMAGKLGALVAINGGYFDMTGVPARTFSLVMRDGKVLVPNISLVNRANPPRAYPVTRSAFGIRANRTFDVAWVAAQGGALWAYPKPVAHTMSAVAPPPTRQSPTGGGPWDAMDAIGAGPTLISDGVIQDTYENEVFFDAGFPNNEPYTRAAIGYTKDNHLILLATDGRHRGPGLSLQQTAQEMQRLGCIEAMNLDGGGSETLVVKGKTLNQAPGRARAVTSILAIVPNAPNAQ
jgi:hypothetical protein